MKKFAQCLFLLGAILWMSTIMGATTPDEPVLPPELQKALTQHPENESVQPSTGDLYLEFFKMIFMLGVIIAFLLMIMWFIKRMLSTRIEQLNTTSVIKILERRPLTQKTVIYVVEAYDKRILLAESHGGVTLLSDLTPPAVTEFPSRQ